MFVETFDYDKVDWSKVFQKKSKVPIVIPSHDSNVETNQEGEGFKEVLQEKIPQFFASPIGREITRSVKDFSSSIASGTPIAKAIRQTGRKAMKNLIGIGRKRGVSKLGEKVRPPKKQDIQKRETDKNYVRPIKVNRQKRSLYISSLS